MKRPRRSFKRLLARRTIKTKLHRQYTSKPRGGTA